MMTMTVIPSFDDIVPEVIKAPQGVPTGLQDGLKLEQVKEGFEQIPLSTEDTSDTLDTLDTEINTTDTNVVTEPIQSDNEFLNKAQDLIEKGFVTFEDVAEEFDGKPWDESTYLKFLEFSLQKSKEKEPLLAEQVSEETFNNLLENVSDITRRALEFERTSPDSEDVKTFYRQLLYEADIKELNPQDSVDAEKIITEYYRSMGESREEITERLADLKTLNKVEKEALNIKPKLDKKVEQIAQEKIAIQKAILEQEAQDKEVVRTKLKEVFKENTLDGIPLTKEIKAFLEGALVDDEFKVKYKGKEVMIGGAEWLINHFKTQNPRHLAKVLIHLQAPQIFEESYVKKVQSKETQRFLREHKISADTKSGILQEKKEEQVTGMRLRPSS